MKHNPYKINQMFEETMAEYCGSKYAVSVDCCTNALFLSLMYIRNHSLNLGNTITIPLRTYLSVPQAILMSGFELKFEDIDWKGMYQLKPFNVYDSAKRLTKNMYIPGSLMCLSFHIKKHIPIGKGGMILTDNEHAYEYLKKIRYEGRSEIGYHDDNIKILGYNMYMTPVDCARGLMLMQNYPDKVEDLVEIPNYKPLNENDFFSNVHVVERKEN